MDPSRQTQVQVSSLFSHLIYKEELLSKSTALQLLQVLGPHDYSGSKLDGQTVMSMASPLVEIISGVALADIDRDDNLGGPSPPSPSLLPGLPACPGPTNY